VWKIVYTKKGISTKAETFEETKINFKKRKIFWQKIDCDF
jgi:hypothetical protein